MRSYFKVPLLCGLAGLVASCAALQDTGAPGDAAPLSKTGSASSGVAAPPPAHVRLERGDRLKVSVFNEPQLSGEFVVEGAGTIAFPLVGQVEVAGATARDVEQRLRQKLDKRFLVNPKVSVEIVSQRPFYILGEVGKAGEYPYRPGLNIVSAIALAGGFGPRAATSHVMIRRSDDAQAKEYPVTPTIAVQPGDLITVPERYF